MMRPPPPSWLRLVAAARRRPPVEADLMVPPGFATRVVALAFASVGERPLLGLFERFSWRALGVAGGLAAASVLLNITPAVHAFQHDIAAEQDPVAVVLDLAR